MATKPLVIFVLGGPGAGKGTQCQKIVEKFGFIHLSAGDLLRAERNSGSPDGELINTHIKEGKIVPVAITLSLIERAMNNSDVKKFLIDGFPRNADNLDGWNSQMEGKVDVKFVLFFKCSKEVSPCAPNIDLKDYGHIKVCVARIMERGKSSGRADDNEESLTKRFKTYIDSTQPIIDRYEKLGLVRTINGESEPDKVFSEVSALFTEEGF